MSNQGPYPIPLSVDEDPRGIAITFSKGPFEGRTIRTVATELQKADAGRKFAQKDRRPLDPPPVVQVQFFEVLRFGAPDQFEKEITNYDDTLVLGLVCQVDIFPIPDELTSEGTASRDIGSIPMTGIVVNPVSTNTIPYGAFAQTNSPSQPFPLLGPTIAGPSSMTSSFWQGSEAQSQADHQSITDNTALVSYNEVQELIGSVPDRVIAYFKNYAITESSNCTYLLAGSRVASAVNIEWNSRQTLAFVFNDLAVQQEGAYTLRYRVLNIFARTTNTLSAESTTPVLASCFGGVFRIWSSKSFPGLAPSTSLTRRLSLYGMHVNIRTSKRKKSTNEASPNHPEPGASASPERQASWLLNDDDESGGSPESHAFATRHSRHSGDWPGIYQ